jgi:hypothetical protein
MAEPWLSQLQELIDRLPAQDENHAVITCKHFFSGAAAYSDGQIFMSLSPVGLALKLPEGDCATLIADGGKQLKYFDKSPVKKGYAVLSDKSRDNEQDRHFWIVRSLRHLTEQNKVAT